MKKYFLVVGVILLFLVASCAPEQPAQNQGAGSENNNEQVKLASPIKIGVMYPLTGDGAAYGLPIQRATKIAVDEINSKGGIDGRKLEIVYEDSKCNPKDGNAAAQKLINVDKVKVIIGGVCSGETLGAAPLAEENKVILISPSATSPDITNAGDFVFRLSPSDAYAGIVASDYAFKDLKGKKAAVISEATDYSQGLRKVFTKHFEELGGKIVADEVYNPEDTDFRTQVTKVKASGADVVYFVPQTVPKAVLLVKQMRESGLKSKYLSAELLIGQRNIIKENAQEFEGIIGIEQKFDDKNPKAAAMLAKYKEQNKEDGPFPQYMSAAYDIVYILSDSIKENGYDSEKIRDYLYGLKDYDGAVGKVTLDKNGEPLMEYSIKQIKNGELVLLN